MTKMAFLWLLSLVAVALMASTFTAAQVYTLRPVSPYVIAGDDFGFRVTGDQGGTPVGTLVVRVNDEWVEVNLGAGTRPLVH